MRAPDLYRRQPRRTIRLDDEAYATPGQPFLVTFNLRWDAGVSLAEPPLATTAQRMFTAATEAVPCDVFVGCVMPDHVHAIVAARPGSSVVRWVQAYKSLVARDARAFGVRGLWQRRFHDRAIRQEEGVLAAALYVLDNPVRRRLVGTWQDWPLKGSLEWDLAEI
ncbi:MAG: transposase [Planctomycetota bacterium]